MARVFVSHAREDGQAAADWHAWLVAHGHEVFLDQHRDDGIALGEDWEKRLYERLRWADALLCLVTSSYLVSPWCFAEVAIARFIGTRPLPVRLEREVEHPLLQSIQYADYVNDPEKARYMLSTALHGGLGWPDGTSPYPGLRPFPFHPDMRRVLFGRDLEVRTLTNLLRSSAVQAEGQLVVVFGSSGCGKSSLVRAGVLPAICEEDGWSVLTPIFPGSDPVTALAGELAVAGRGHDLDWTSNRVRKRLWEDEMDVVVAELLAATSGHQLLITVDQLEELVTQSPIDDRIRFTTALRTALRGQVRAIATLRSEFMPALLDCPELSGLPIRTVPLQPLPPEALPAVIEGPAGVAGLRIDAALVSRLVADTGSGEALPLLAFTLERLAEGVKRGGRLTLRRYEEVGRVQGAVARQADAALNAAIASTGRSREEVVSGLLCLVALDESGRPMRRRFSYGAIPESIQEVLNAFIDTRLLVTDTDTTGATVIEIAHDAFLSAWWPLATAIDAAIARLRTIRSIEEAAAAWEQAGRPHSRLWNRGQLAAAGEDIRLPTISTLPFRRSMADAGDEALSPLAIEFLRASLRRQRGHWTRSIAIACVAVVVLAGILEPISTTAFFQWGYNANTFQLSRVVLSRVHKVASRPSVTCGHVEGRATFERGPMRLGAMTIGGDACWDGVVVSPESTSFVCTLDYPAVTSAALRWCSFYSDNPSSLSGGANFVVYPFTNSSICVEGYIRVKVNALGELRDSASNPQPDVTGAVLPGCAYSFPSFPQPPPPS